MLSSHRLNYAHLDEPWSEASRTALRELLAKLAADGAVFLTDSEVRQLTQHGWSARSLGARGTLLRDYDVPREVIRIAAPEGATGAVLRAAGGTNGSGEGEVKVEGGMAEVRVNLGEHLIEWTRA